MGRKDELHQGLVPVPSIFGKEQRTASDLIAILGEIAWLLTVDIEIHMIGKKAKKKEKDKKVNSTTDSWLLGVLQG